MSLEIWFGPMFAGKSSAIIGTIRRNAFIRRTTLCLTHSLDTRYSDNSRIVTHDMVSYPAKAVSELMPLLESADFKDATCIIVEEAQFFKDLRNFALEAVEKHGKHLICVGLNGDAERKPFGEVIDLVPYADHVKHFSAMCAVCCDGTAGIFSFRSTKEVKEQVFVGADQHYIALCRRHYLLATQEKLD
jgi:thymidine kinase